MLIQIEGLPSKETAMPFTCNRIRPLGSLVLFRPDPPKESEGMFLLPEASRKRTNIGTIVDVGAGKRGKDGARDPWCFDPGDRALCSAYVSETKEAQLTIDGVLHYLCNGDKIRFVLPKDGGAPHPIGDKVLVKMVEHKLRSDFIIIPETAQPADESLEAEVVSLGTGGRNKDGTLKPFNVTVGQRVWVERWMGTSISIDSKELAIYASSEITAIQ